MLDSPASLRFGGSFVDEIEIAPLLRPLAAAVRVPGSKSITNRALLLAAMADGPSQIEGALFSDDTRYMLGALRQLGFMIAEDELRGGIGFEGRGGEIPAHDGDLFIGGAGTAMRFLAAFLTLGCGRFRLDGNARMRERPIGELVDALRRLGINARSEHGNDCPPIVLEPRGRDFEGGTTMVDAHDSSQFASALLLPAPLWKKGLQLRVIGEAGRPFIDLTLRMMRQWGVESGVEGDSILVPGGQRYRAQKFAVEGDASSASYFAAAAALCGGSVRLENLHTNSIQGDLCFLGVLEQMGARLHWSEAGVEVHGGEHLRGVDLDLSAMPDMVPTLAILAPFAESATRIRNVGFIRHHESDRIHALARELRRMGARVLEFEDGLEIEPSQLRPAAIETYDDHRIAMSFAIAGLKLPGIRIRNPDCVSKTYPGFFVDLAALG
jgi:3-phosphoshikimate 1-carboxyvinyltransferase